MPIGHVDTDPDDVKLRDHPSVTVGRGDFAARRPVGGTCIPDILVIADVVLVILGLAVAANDDRGSWLPEPGSD